MGELRALVACPTGAPHLDLRMWPFFAAVEQRRGAMARYRGDPLDPNAEVNLHHIDAR